jgi:TonB family protein
MSEHVTDRRTPDDASVSKAAEENTTRAPPATGDSKSDPPSPGRLVIRVKIAHEAQPPVPVPRRLSAGALSLIAVAVAAVLSWVGIGMFKTEPASAPAATASAPNLESRSPAPAAPAPAPSEAAPQVIDKPPEVREEPDAPPSPVNEVIPTVPRSALDTIRGTIRVVIRVTLDKQGAVKAATADVPGPSRYFARLAGDASKKWTFTPANSEAQRTMLITYNFTRNGATARANPPQ